MNKDILSVTVNFRGIGTCRDVRPLGSGHIHDTFLASCESGTYVLQKLNERVFPNVERLMANIDRVTRHLSDVHGAETFRVVPTHDGPLLFRGADQQPWRMLTWIEDTVSFDQLTDTSQATEAARAYAGFQLGLSDLPGPPLEVVIPDFHHTPRRLGALREAIDEDPARRRAGAGAEIGFILDREEACSAIQNLVDRGLVEDRIAHNDTKINNVLYDQRNGEARCVIDLDTVMPGLWIHDFGDLVRTAACRAGEDETDLERVFVDTDLFAALARGYLQQMGNRLSPVETDNLVTAARVLCLETGIRFLADHLSGDSYFKIHRPGQNLDRCRMQFKLVRDLEQKDEQLREIVEASM